MTPIPDAVRLPVFALVSLLAVAAVPATGQEIGAGDVSAEAWRADLDRLERAFVARHLDAFHTMSRSGFERGLQRIRERVGAWPDHVVAVQLAAVVNRVGDGHSGIRLFSDTALSFRSYPVKLRVFPGGIHVVAAGPGHEQLVGGRVTRIGDRSAAAALATVADLIARDNGMDALTFGPALLVMPEVLEGAGIVASPDSAVFEIERDGRTRTIRLVPTDAPFRLEGHSLLDRRDRAEGWTRLLDGEDGRGVSAPPLLHRDPTVAFWSEWLPGERALYVQVNEMADRPEESFADFARRVVATAEERGAEKLVVDLRWCRGGNGYLIRPLVLGLVKSAFDAPGRLYVLTGRRTFSAGQMLVSELARLSHARFVGEPTANRPNLYGDNEKIVLPESGLTVRAAYVQWQLRDPRDDRPCAAPHVLAPWTVEDWRRGRDPALRAALAWSPEGEPPRSGAGPATDGQGIYSVFLCRNGGPRTGSMY